MIHGAGQFRLVVGDENSPIRRKPAIDPLAGSFTCRFVENLERARPESAVGALHQDRISSTIRCWPDESCAKRFGDSSVT